MSDKGLILVVDDNEMNRDLLSRRLRRKGFEVEVAIDGPEALAAIESRPIDLVLLDIMMPGMSGTEVLRRVRETRDANQLPIIMATAKSGSQEVVEALDLGANDYVTKPIDFPVLLARVQATLRTRSSRSADAPEARQPPEVIEPGATLGGRYRLAEKIGSGNFGAVYRGRHLDLDQPVAIKALQATFERKPEDIARFRQEGISACRIKHPNAVHVFDFGVTANGDAYLVMELLEGESLLERISRRGQLSVDEALEILSPLCEVLADAHGQGIIHRDIKPANIFLQRTQRGEVVKVLDFGIAKLSGDAVVREAVTLDGSILGTPAYMAPERVSNEKYDGSADVYSVGIVLYEMLTGQRPFGPEASNAIAVAMMHLTHEPRPLRTLRSDLSPAIEEIVMSTLSKDPSTRPTSLELARRFAAARSAPTSPAPVAGSTPPIGSTEDEIGTEVLLRPPSREGRLPRPDNPSASPGVGFFARWWRRLTGA